MQILCWNRISELCFFVVKPCKVVVNIVWSLVHQNIVYHTVSFYLIQYFNKRVLPVKCEMFSVWQIVCMTWKTRYIMLVWVFQMCTADMSDVLGTLAWSLISHWQGYMCTLTLARVYSCQFSCPYNFLVCCADNVRSVKIIMVKLAFCSDSLCVGLFGLVLFNKIW